MSSRREIVKEPNKSVFNDTIYVAVAKDVKDSKLNLIWAIQNSGGNRICILHVHKPAPMVPLTLMGAKFPASALKEQEVQAYRETEKQEMNNKTMDVYLVICQRMGVRAEKLLIEMDCIEKGIVELISQYSIQKLVMGAASDKYHSRRMTELRSRKAIYVCEQAPASCHIQFICKGYLIHTRDRSLDRGNAEVISPLMQQISNSKFSGSPHARLTTKEDLRHASPSSVLDRSMEEALYEKLEQAKAEAETARQEAHQENIRSARAEKDAIDALCRTKATEISYKEELKLRKELKEAVEKAKKELDKMKSQGNQVNAELRVALHYNSSLENHIASTELKLKELEQKIISCEDLLQNYKDELDDLQMQLDIALKEAEELRRKEGEAFNLFSEFSFSEIKEATSNFNPSLKIGEGGYGSIFKGILRHTEVAIKMLNPKSMQGPSEFQQEVEVLSKLRHPNLITLIGACPESFTLIYEYLPNGSLEDHLTCKDNRPPLSWKTRIRIAAELCSALIFLHSNKPHSIVHVDLKPSNILLDENLVSKLSDFGICRVLSCQEESSSNNSTQFWITSPKGTFVYMDPEFLASGELTSKSDVYSFGIILLRLLTGKPGLRITKEVQYALNTGKLRSLLDPLAGEWPFVLAEELVRLALRCCAMNRKNRPELDSDVCKILEQMRASSGGTSAFQIGSQGLFQPPPYFICPIFLEVMQDPHVAADGFTYEAEAIRGWLESGHGTSPRTNSKLSHHNLVPNHALRIAIQDWLRSH